MPLRRKNKIPQQKKVVALFIGGASDKETYYGHPATKIIQLEVSDKFDDLIDAEKIKGYKSLYLGYNEVKGEDDIKSKIVANIHDRENTAIYIIGHSLGGWNGAHLSQILTDKGYNVDLLITLDPVGTGADVKLISDITGLNPAQKPSIGLT